MRRVSIVLLLLLGAADNALAQTAPMRLTLDEAIARGLEASPRLEELSAAGRRARRRRQREAAQQPQIAAIAGYTRTNHVEEFGVPNASGGVRVIYPDIPEQRAVANRSAVADLHRRPSAGAHARGGRGGRRRRAGSRGGARRSQAGDHARVLAVLTARASVDVVRQALERTGAHLNDVRNQFGVGLVPPSDVLTIEAQHARQQMLSIEAENILETTTAEFKRLSV